MLETEIKAPGVPRGLDWPGEQTGSGVVTGAGGGAFPIILKGRHRCRSWLWPLWTVLRLRPGEIPSLKMGLRGTGDQERSRLEFQI